MRSSDSGGAPRSLCAVTVVVHVRQTTADGKSRLMEFRCRELSHEELFIAADDLSLLDVGEKVQVLVSAPGEPFVASRARVIGSERVFGQSRGLTASGYRLRLVAPDAQVRAVVDRYLAAACEAGLPETGIEPARFVKTKGF